MWACAVSKLCRRLFADCFAGGTYAPEDMRDEDDLTADEVIDVEGTVAEPGSAAPRGDNGTPEDPTGEPSTAASDVASGSATAQMTPWQILLAKAEEDGIDRDALINAASERFRGSGRTASSFTVEETGLIWEDVTGQGVLA